MTADEILEGLEFYNKEIKVRFLKEKVEINVNKKYYAIVLSKVSGLENILGKDLCNFNLEENKLALQEQNAYTVGVLSNYKSVLSKYTDFAIKEGFGISPKQINYVKMIKTEDLAELTSKIKREQTYITKQELDDITDNCINVCDAFAIQAWFEGVKGDESCEVRNLKMSDINTDTNIMLLTDKDGSKREFLASDKLIELAIASYNQIEYEPNIEGERENNRTTKPLMPSEYVIKPTAKSKTDNIASLSLTVRTKKMLELLGFGYLTATKIYRSGIIYEMNKLEKEEGKEIKKQEFLKILRKYNYNEDSYYLLLKELQNKEKED